MSTKSLGVQNLSQAKGFCENRAAFWGREMDRRIKGAVLCSALLAACSALFAQSAPKFNGQTWWNYVKVLAADDMEGRETGSAGEKKAQAYVVDQLKKDGLQPAGNNGFFQPVKFRSKAIDESQSS